MGTVILLQTQTHFTTESSSSALKHFQTSCP